MFLFEPKRILSVFTKSHSHGRIRDLKKEGVQGVRVLAPNIILANLGDLIFKEFGAKRGGHAPPL